LARAPPRRGRRAGHGLVPTLPRAAGGDRGRRVLGDPARPGHPRRGRRRHLHQQQRVLRQARHLLSRAGHAAGAGPGLNRSERPALAAPARSIASPARSGAPPPVAGTPTEGGAGAAALGRRWTAEATAPVIGGTPAAAAGAGAGAAGTGGAARVKTARAGGSGLRSTRV